jgi:hypothetical protein
MNKNSHSVRSRIITDVILFFAVLHAPWWFVAFILLLGAWYFKNFYEAFFFGLLFDMLYGAGIASFHGFQFVFSSAFLVLIFAVDFVKAKIRV